MKQLKQYLAQNECESTVLRHPFLASVDTELQIGVFIRCEVWAMTNQLTDFSEELLGFETRVTRAFGSARARADRDRFAVRRTVEDLSKRDPSPAHRAVC